MICQKCGKYLVRGSLVGHLQAKHGVEKGGLVQEVDGEAGGDKTSTFRMDFPMKEGPRPLPVKGCSGWAATGTEMQVHFCH